MNGELEVIPISEPLTPIPIFDPKIYDYALELAYPPEQRDWIKRRDGGRCQFPVLDANQNFYGFYYEDAHPRAGIVNIHHITPTGYMRRWMAQDDPNSPLNGITLSVDLHNGIHREWVKRYEAEYKRLSASERYRMSQQAYIERETSKGRSWWVDRYDWFFCAIATINSWDAITDSDARFPFDKKYLTEIELAYRQLESFGAKFLRQYRKFQEQS